MAIYVNGVKVAGRGISGKSPYQIAVGEGYTGTEAEFNAQLAAIGEAVAGFDELSDQVDNAKADVEAAVTSAQQMVSSAMADINSTVNRATATIAQAVTAAENQIDNKVEDALSQIPDAENLATKVYVQEQLENVQVDLTGYATETWVQNKISDATASIVTDIWYYGSSAPSNKKLLWIDSNTSTGGLKFYKSSSEGWVHVPVAWQ